MAKFVEFIDNNNVKHCINVDWIVDFYPYDLASTQIRFGIPQVSGNGQSHSSWIYSICVKETYEKVQHKLDD